MLNSTQLLRSLAHTTCRSKTDVAAS